MVIKTLLRRYILFLVFFVVMVIFFGLTTNGLIFSPMNIYGVFQTSVAVGIIALGQTVVVLSGNIDLSVGATFNLCMAILIFGFAGGLEGWMIFFLVLVAGLFVGIANSTLVYLLGVSSFVATIGTMFFVNSLAYTIGLRMITLARLIQPIRSAAGGIFPYGEYTFPIFVWILTGIVIFFIIRYTVYGREICAVGGNPTVARTLGISIKRVNFLTYTLSGLLVGISLILWVFYTYTTGIAIGESYLLPSIAAVVIGGTSIWGGIKGFGESIIGTIIGTLMIGFIFNYLTLIGIAAIYHEIFAGVLLLFAAIATRKIKVR